MVIGIDGNEANVKVRVGIGEYAFELLNQFKEYRISNIEFQIYLKSKPLPHMPNESKWWQYKVFGPAKLWTQFALPARLLTQIHKPDVFFTPSHYAPRFSTIPTAIAIMDVSYLKFPQLFNKDDLYQLKNWTAYSVKNASRIFTISNSSKDDIIKYYKVEPEKVFVTHLGIKEDSSSIHSVSSERAIHELSMENVQKKYSLSKNYVLFVGTLQPRKNIVRLIESFSKLSDQNLPKNLELVIVGKKGWQYEEILAAPKKYDILDKVKFLEFVQDEDLEQLYKNALCFVLPSLYEGFGLPILEAMKQGCPVITSNVSSMPEAGGDAAEYINPESVQDITSKLQKVLTSETLRKEMTKKGYEQIKKFSWEKTARETLDVLQSVVKQN